MLDDPGCRRALCDAVGEAGRVVLLGDVIELRERPWREVLPAARPTIEALAESLRAGTEVVLLAGNHDHRLVQPWLRRRDRAEPLESTSIVPVAPADPVRAIAEPLLAEVRYPGHRLRGDVWATHGHYGDRHTTVPILERLSAGVMARVTGETAGGPRTVEEYEAVLAPIYAWIDALAEHGTRERDLEGSEAAWLALRASQPLGRSVGSVVRELRRRALRAGFPLAVHGLERLLGSGPLSPELSREALRRGPLVAMGEVTRRLGIDARWVLFGHTHRAGPLPGDDPAPWRTPSGAALLNTGCWVREGALLGSDPARSPYRAGFVAWVDDDPGRAPELVNLLD